jgi:hypothetical protein
MSSRESPHLRLTYLYDLKNVSGVDSKCFYDQGWGSEGTTYLLLFLIRIWISNLFQEPLNVAINITEISIFTSKQKKYKLQVFI